MPKSRSGSADDVVVVDDDSDSSDCVVIDVSDSYESDSREHEGSREERRFSSCGVISIDDDDDEGEVRQSAEPHVENEECKNEGDPAGVRFNGNPVNKRFDFFASSRRYYTPKYPDYGKRPAFNISRCTKSYAAAGFSRNRFGLSSDHESDSSDCEILDDPSVEVRDLWRNSARRKIPCECNDGTDQCSSESSVASSTKNTKPQEKKDSKYFTKDLNGDDDHKGVNASDSRSKGNASCSLNSLFKSEKEYFRFVKEIFNDNVSTAAQGNDDISENGHYPFNSHKGEGHANQSVSSDDCSNMRGNAMNDIEAESNGSFADSIPKPSAKFSDENMHDYAPFDCPEIPDQVEEENFVENEQKEPSDTAIPTSSEVREEKPSTSNVDESALPNKIVDQSISNVSDELHDKSENIITLREQIKETDEYKLAMEQEWISRQQQLQIQAEEAQRLRKRKKAALDMEVRQKRRLEEIRKSKEKDEENLNLKDQLRAEVRKELDLLEKVCIDLPSLLRGLGIPLGAHPLSNEVHAAYKRALLKFHPDRVANSDIRHQVEAEEKFKLICQMKK